MDSFKVRMLNMRSIIEKIKERQAAAAPDSTAVKRALQRAAILITSQAKLNVRRQGLIDTGRLINSLRWEFYKRGDVNGISIGSFGVPYAAFWEFGFHGQVPVRSHNRVITRAFGRSLEKATIARVRAHQRRIDKQGRPYLYPAYEKHKTRIVQYMLDAI